MNTEQIREKIRIITERDGLTFFEEEVLCSLLEIAAQIAEMNLRQRRAAESARDASLEQDLARGKP